MTVGKALDRSRLKDVVVPVLLNSSLLVTSEDDPIPVNFEAYDAQELESGLIEQANRAFEQTLSEGQQLLATRGNMQEASSNHQESEEDSETSPQHVVGIKRLRTRQSSSSDSYVPSSDESDDAKIEISEDDGNACQPSTSALKATSRKRKRGGGKKRRERLMRDDGDEQHFVERRRYAELEEEADRGSEVHHINDDHFVSKHAWGQLYKYQKAGVRWLHQLHSQYVGGILADEMGLGKTIQVCVFLRSIAQSQQPSRIFKQKGLGPVLIVCPATIMHQWVRELNTWFPLCRVAVLHASGAHTGPKHRLLSTMTAWRKDGSVLITSYSTYTQDRASFLKFDWYYVILDEGHKIRNPDAMVTMSLKELKTPHRLILTGSPMQNNLRELWSLNDFIFPGHLGSLKDFTERFSIPITQGGYANASPLQKEQHKRPLRDAISPYMLRRTKKEVEMAIQLPEKTEQILFCDITEAQRQLYLDFLISKQCGNILTGRIDAFAGLITLRKLWWDLPTGKDIGRPNRHGEYDVAQQPEMDFGDAVRSGKMWVLKSLLRLWRKQQQKVLLFSQSRQMLTILEKFVILQGYNYLRLDGTTPIGVRQGLVEQFNANDEIFVFLLTTRVGGLGVNLTGANRVVIYDPDWNPSTDVQARERAWRIGQRRPVTVYRLLTSGTIEEKIYQRQIFKHFLVNKVLVDPRQQRFFKTNDLHELFTLDSGKTTEKGHGTETAAIFASTAKEMRRDNYFDQQAKSQRTKARNGRQDRRAQEGDAVEDEGEVGEMELAQLSEDRKRELMELAKRIAKSLGESEKAGDCLPTTAASKGLFEGRHHIPYLRRQKLMKHSGEGRAGAKEELRNSRQQDDYVLKKLLKGKAGVNSTLRHDQIIDGSSAADLQLIEDEAEAVAKRAAQVLKKTLRAPTHGSSRPLTRLFGTRADTWNSGAPSSSSLLKSIRERKERMLEIREDDGSQASSNEDYPSLASTSGVADVLPMGDRFESIANALRAFFIGRAGRASTDEVLARFNEDISPADSFAFRSILKRLARLQPNTSQWLLKEEYR